MADLSTIPEILNIKHLAGDTLTIHLRAPQSMIAGKQWLGQIKRDRITDTVDATFVITPPPDDNSVGSIVLTAAESARLAGTLGTTTQTLRAARAGIPAQMAAMIYEGVYDVQISLAGSDPVKTLVMGTLSIELDVSRE